MQITITIRQGADLGELHELIEVLGRELREKVMVYEAPENLDYPFAFPVVTVAIKDVKNRQFGENALALLRDAVQEAPRLRASA